MITGDEKNFWSTLKRIARELARTWRTEVDAECATGRWQTSVPRFHIYYRASNLEQNRLGGVCVAQTAPGPDWQLASPHAIKPGWRTDVAAAWIYAMIADVPILPLDPSAVVYRGYLCPTAKDSTIIYFEKGYTFKVWFSSLTNELGVSRWPHLDQQETEFGVPFRMQVPSGKLGKRFIQAIDHLTKGLKPYKVTIRPRPTQ